MIFSDAATRRGALRLLSRPVVATIGGAALLTLSGPARAFRLLPEEDFAPQLTEACAVDTSRSHAELLAEVQKELGIELDQETAQAILAQMSCPNCGCNLRQAYLEGRSAGF